MAIATKTTTYSGYDPSTEVVFRVECDVDYRTASGCFSHTEAAALRIAQRAGWRRVRRGDGVIDVCPRCWQARHFRTPLGGVYPIIVGDDWRMRCGGSGYVVARRENGALYCSNGCWPRRERRR